jgi:hypothetical protein
VPSAADLRFLDADYYAGLGRLLEQGCFELMFFDDRLAMPGIYGNSVADAVRYGAARTFATGPRFVGTATQVADQMQEWFSSDACDGFVLAATHFPGAFEDVVRIVVPELQSRGLFRNQCTGGTLRERLGLAKPEIPALTDAAGV